MWLLLSQLLDEDADGGCLRSHVLDESVVVLPLRLQAHLKTHLFSIHRRRKGLLRGTVIPVLMFSRAQPGGGCGFCQPISESI